MAKGQEAKNKVVEVLKSAFGNDYIAEEGGKHYVWSKEDGQKVQIAISLTCPKNPITVVDTSNLDFGDEGINFADPVQTVVVPETADFSPEEEETLEQLLAKLF